jgi:hypothetical protein
MLLDLQEMEPLCCLCMQEFERTQAPQLEVGYQTPRCP